ncbi:hypothetical protein ACP70R_039270 [Stipagrostis hirtigluma subsp. patula]
MLQYLLLRNCRRIDTLPKGIGRLRNLRCLDISGSGISKVKWSFRGMEELTSMQGFPMGNNGLLQSLDLKFPKKLAVLRVEKLENVLNPSSENHLRVEKYELKELELCYSSNANPPLVPEDRFNKLREVLDRFRPNKRLVRLKIENYYGKQYPSWILMMPNLQRLHLQRCVWCKEMPSLGALPQLKFLAVTGFDWLPSLGAELRGDVDTKVAFPRLQQLHIVDMQRLERWSDLEVQDLPQLQELRLFGCQKLTTIPIMLKNSTTLTSLEVDTRTENVIAGKLKGFAEGVVINVDKKSQPLESPDFVTPNAHPSQQGEDVEVALATQTADCSITEQPKGSWYSMKAFHFDRKKAAVFMLAAFAVYFVLYIVYVLLGTYVVPIRS